jgi:hypothetical protein
MRRSKAEIHSRVHSIPHLRFEKQHLCYVSKMV